jgi:hypothetical protein
MTEVITFQSGKTAIVICDNEDPVTISRNLTDTIDSLQNKIAVETRYPAANLRFSVAGVSLSQTVTLNTKNICSGSSLWLFLMMKGGWSTESSFFRENLLPASIYSSPQSHGFEFCRTRCNCRIAEPLR